MIENKIKEIQEYFKEKILKWEFEFVTEDYYSTILVDWKYKFTFRFYDNKISMERDVWDQNFFIINLSEEEEKKFYETLKNIWYVERLEEEKRNEKMKQYEKLKKELGL